MNDYLMKIEHMTCCEGERRYYCIICSRSTNDYINISDRTKTLFDVIFGTSLILSIFYWPQHNRIPLILVACKRVRSMSHGLIAYGYTCLSAPLFLSWFLTNRRTNNPTRTPHTTTITHTMTIGKSKNAISHQVYSQGKINHEK